MKWDIFSNRKKERRHHRKDEIDEIIDIIEKFAPRKYRPENVSLTRKFRELFLFFYDKKDFSTQEIGGWLI